LSPRFFLYRFLLSNKHIYVSFFPSIQVVSPRADELASILLHSSAAIVGGDGGGGAAKRTDAANRMVVERLSDLVEEKLLDLLDAKRGAVGAALTQDGADDGELPRLGAFKLRLGRS
jgi:hypothetical protein